VLNWRILNQLHLDSDELLANAAESIAALSAAFQFLTFETAWFDVGTGS
jgi:hypothetical protein